MTDCSRSLLSQLGRELAAALADVDSCCAFGGVRGKQPKLNPRQETHLVALHAAGEHTSAELAELFGVARSTVYRAIERAASARAPDPRRD